MKSARFLIVVFVLSIASTLFPTVAQETASACTKDKVDLAVAAVAKSAQDAQAASDPKAAVDILASTVTEVAMLQADCNGLSFTGKTPTLLGPITIPAGIYKAIVKSSGHLTSVLTVLDGECGQGSGSYLATALFIGVESDAETIFSSSGCSLLIEMQDPDWALKFTKIK